jgi:glycosyltransferase involved in cell wall biosynthesis
MTVIEAQNTGAVVIAAYSNNMSKMIENEVNGFLYHIQPNYQLNYVISIFESLSTEAKDEMSKAAHQHFLKTYTLERHVDALKQLYHFEPKSK